jgi:hypothetical protein
VLPSPLPIVAVSATNSDSQHAPSTSFLPLLLVTPVQHQSSLLWLYRALHIVAPLPSFMYVYMAPLPSFVYAVAPLPSGMHAYTAPLPSFMYVSKACRSYTVRLTLHNCLYSLRDRNVGGWVSRNNAAVSTMRWLTWSTTLNVSSLQL